MVAKGLMSISYCRDGETRYAIDSPLLYELIYVIVALIVSVVLGRVAPTSFNFEPGSDLNLNLVQA